MNGDDRPDSGFEFEFDFESSLSPSRSRFLFLSSLVVMTRSTLRCRIREARRGEVDVQRYRWYERYMVYGSGIQVSIVIVNMAELDK